MNKSMSLIHLKMDKKKESPSMVAQYNTYKVESRCAR